MAAAETAAPVTAPKSRWERLRDSKAGVWCRSLVSDYKEACREMVVGAWERPAKASVYVSLLGGTWACFYTRPDQSSFEGALLEHSNQLALLSPWIRNATSDGQIQSLVKLCNQGRLRHASLGLLSLVYSSSYDPDTSLYDGQCSSLSEPWWEFHQRILDVGFAGCWWILNSKMREYDVNTEEFKHLLAHMQATSPPSAQEVERNERLYKESWLAVTMEDEQKETKAVGRKEERISEESQIKPLKEYQTPDISHSHALCIKNTFAHLSCSANSANHFWHVKVKALQNPHFCSIYSTLCFLTCR